jgi:hypothetical protein
MRKTVIPGLLSVLLVSGCAIHDARPLVSDPEVPAQYKLKSAAHWQVVAADVASQVDAGLKQGNFARVPLQVSDGKPGSKFSTVFASQLRSRLVQQGLTVVESSPAAIDVSVAVEQVRHGKPRRAYRPGILTALTAGVLVVRDAVLHESSVNVTGMAFAMALDASQSLQEFLERPSTEVVLTTALKHNGIYVMHRTDVYYVDEVDAGLFDGGQRQFNVVGMK